VFVRDFSPAVTHEGALSNRTGSVGTLTKAFQSEGRRADCHRHCPIALPLRTAAGRQVGSGQLAALWDSDFLLAMNHVCL